VAGTERAERGRPATDGRAAGFLEAAGQRNLRAYLAALTGLLMLASLYLIFMVAPTDSVLGHVQRVFYFHVPIAIMSFLAFFLVFVASIAYLVRRNERWDSVAHACAEVGVVFVTLALLTGIIWARPVWDTWWTWEPRLTTTLILWLIYVAYLMIRAYAPSRAKGALYSAVVGIIGFVDVPIVYYSVVWWRSIHPSPVVGPLSQADALNGTMYGVLLFSFTTFFVLFVYLVLERASLRDAEDQIGRLRSSLRRSGRL
jgi:heme exporter protein C